jgi:hypothetical protein
MPSKAMPTVAMVDQALPVARETILQVTTAANRKILG